MDLIPRYEGVYRAVVKNNKDPQNLRRIKVVVPQITGDQVTDWLWPVISTERPPAVGTGTWVMYIGGNPDYPVWIGEFGQETQGVFAYGAWGSTADQTVATINTAYDLTVNYTDYEEGITVIDNSKFKVAESGTYNFQFSAQIHHRVGGGGGPGDLFWIWLKVNGVNVPNSTGQINLSSGKYTLTGWNYVLELVHDDYVELVWAAESTNMAVEHINAASPYPASPSLSVTMNQIA